MKYDDFLEWLQAVCPDVDVARAKKNCAMAWWMFLPTTTYREA